MTYAQEYLARREQERAEAMAIRLTGRATCAHCGAEVGASARSPMTGPSKLVVVLQEHTKPGQPRNFCIAGGTVMVFEE